MTARVSRLIILLTLLISAAGLAVDLCQGENGNPEFTPDGEWILFTSTRDGNSEVYRMRVGGSEQQNLSRNDATELHPVVLPGNRYILFDSNRLG
ncbi:MAG: hypothetical protein V3T39_03035 [Gammaproteobacteria bacterium]